MATLARLPGYGVRNEHRRKYNQSQLQGTNVVFAGLIHMQNRAVTLLILLLAVLAPAAVLAAPIGPKMGAIPGTSMTRDEFRARAQAQLAAIALNAVTYQIATGSYAPDIYTLQASPAWNLRVANMFTGRPVQGIYFEPTQDSMTSDPSLGLGGAAERAARRTGRPRRHDCGTKTRDHAGRCGSRRRLRHGRRRPPRGRAFSGHHDNRRRQ